MVVTYYIKLFRTGADRHNGILMSPLHLVAETIIKIKKKQKQERSKFSKEKFQTVIWSCFSEWAQMGHWQEGFIIHII